MVILKEMMMLMMIAIVYPLQFWERSFGDGNKLIVRDSEIRAILVCI
jgi:hypothetical protein